MLELKVPNVGESIREVQIAKWRKQVGEPIERDEEIVELETDKATVELPSPDAGVLTKILKQEGEIVAVGDVIAHFEPGAAASTPADGDSAAGTAGKKEAVPKDRAGEREDSERDAEREAQADTSPGQASRSDAWAVPSARRALLKYGVAAEEVEPSGRGGRLTERDVVEHARAQLQPAEKEVPRRETQPEAAAGEAASNLTHGNLEQGDMEQIVPMSMIRRRIAERLVEAQQTAALLTTFNEVDMSAVMELRQRHQEDFQGKHGVKLGFMSFFVKAAIDALKQFPVVNAEIRGTNIIYRDYYHLGVAIGGGKGLVVPVLRHAERMSFAEIELQIADFAERAQHNKLRPHDLEGGTFTISNGGVYGSLLSTPIVNPPQSGVLGMHAIQERPVARAGQVVIRPMMYLALTYDHRLVDGREAVGFLKRIKDATEEPSRMLIEA